ncbi:MAG: hypothetical protein JJU11_02720 [Candidatus Sumerlaeia bacterium]|nr:hypothetical protein [Candidatus Sumerlaeia bacterium]
MRWDAEVELYYLRNRWYDPYLGRFLQRDPIGFWGDPLNTGNPYTYVGNNPWTYVDPWGLSGIKSNQPRWNTDQGYGFFRNTWDFLGGSVQTVDRVAQSTFAGIGSAINYVAEPVKVYVVRPFTTPASDYVNNHYFDSTYENVTKHYSITSQLVGTGEEFDESSRWVRHTMDTIGEELGTDAVLMLGTGMAGRGASSIRHAPEGRGTGAGAGAGGRINSTCTASFSPLNTSQKRFLRKQARERWKQVSGQYASTSGLQIHHRIPLEWAHIFPKSPPNRISNLVGVRKSTHTQVSREWAQWKAGLGGRQPTPSEIMTEAFRIDGLFHDQWFFPK